MYRKINDKNRIFPTFLYYPHKKRKQDQKFVEIATLDRNITRKGKKEKESWRKSNRTMKNRTGIHSCPVKDAGVVKM